MWGYAMHPVDLPSLTSLTRPFPRVSSKDPTCRHSPSGLRFFSAHPLKTHPAITPAPTCTPQLAP